MHTHVPSHVHTHPCSRLCTCMHVRTHPLISCRKICGIKLGTYQLGESITTIFLPQLTHPTIHYGCRKTSVGSELEGTYLVWTISWPYFPTLFKNKLKLCRYCQKHSTTFFLLRLLVHFFQLSFTILLLEELFISLFVFVGNRQFGVWMLALGHLVGFHITHIWLCFVWFLEFIFASSKEIDGL